MEAIMWTVFILSLFISTERVLGSDEDFRTEPSYIYCRRIFEFDGSVNTSGHIYSPEYEKGSYPNGLTCYYDIRVPEGWRIKVTFKDLDIVPTANCRFDKIDFYEQKGKKVLGIFCGSDIPRPIFSLKGDTLLKIAFHSDYLGSGRGFHIFYEASPYLEECPAEHIICKNRNCVPVSKKCDGIDDCEDGTDEQDCGFPLIVEPKECGSPAIPPKTVSSSPDRMVGGEAVIPNSWPWQVSLQKMYIEPNGHFCGGTLINAQWVVTATHCIAGNPFPENLKIHIGAHNKFKKGKYEQIRTAVKIIAYPDLERENIRKASFAHDITLVKLNAPVKFNDGVHPACLPSLGWHLKEGTSCYATGWGETRGSGGNEALKQMEQIVQPNATCSFNPKTQICVAKHNQSPCHGDSGGPLQCKVGEKWFVFGAASFVTTTNFVTGICTGPGAKTVYVNVADKIDWIRTLINKYS